MVESNHRRVRPRHECYHYTKSRSLVDSERIKLSFTECKSVVLSLDEPPTKKKLAHDYDVLAGFEFHIWVFIRALGRTHLKTLIGPQLHKGEVVLADITALELKLSWD